jgi:hypothetical protein
MSTKKNDFEDRNIKIYNDIKSKTLKDWELVTKYKLSKQRLNQIYHEVEARGLVNDQLVEL